MPMTNNPTVDTNILIKLFLFFSFSSIAGDTNPYISLIKSEE